MKINALTIDHYKLNNRSWEAFEADDNTRIMIKKLADKLDDLEPQGNDHLHTIWIKARRPTYRQFYDYHYEFDYPYRDSDEKTKNTAKKDYQESYPFTNVWFRLSIKHFSRKSGEEFYALFIDKSYVLSVNDQNSKKCIDGTSILEWAIAEAEKVVEAIRNGTYETKILQSIPFIYRNGIIKRSDLWSIDPKFKKAFFADYKKRNIKRFLANFKEKEITGKPLPHMTARTIYEVCAVIYNSLDIHRATANYKYHESDEERARYGGIDQTPKEMYYANADGRDDGLKNVPMDDPDAFEEWSQDSGPYYDFNGHHPWEIIPSFSISQSMHLFPRKTEGGRYYFHLSGESEIRCPDTVVAANALIEAGYPVMISGFDEISKRLNGEDYLSVVSVNDYRGLTSSITLFNDEIGKAIAAKTIWEFDEYRLKERT